MLTLLMLTVSLSASAQTSDDLYSDGFAAYLEKDYERAKALWLEAAEADNVRAMFNLGLLHEQAKIDNASSEQADTWFERASKQGYLAADYHLALRWLAQGGRDEAANDLLKKASLAGYAPAVRRVSPTKSANTASIAIIKSSSNRDLVANTTEASEGNSKYLSKAWIQSKKPESWTIQMLAFSDQDKIEAFIDQHQLHNRAAYFKEKSNEGALYKLVYGVYDSKDKAEFARQNLPATLAEFGPWLRTMESVQSAISH